MTKTSVTKSKKSNKERTGLLVIFGIMAIMGGATFLYSFGLDFTSNKAVVIVDEGAKLKVAQQCEQKLHEYVQQDIAKLEAAMKYGELQNCNFGDEDDQPGNGGNFLLAGAWKMN